MVGAVLAATDPAILIPLFDRLGLRPKVAQTVIAESAFNDPTGTVLALDAGVGRHRRGSRRRRRPGRSTSRRASRSARVFGIARRRRCWRCCSRRTASASGASRRPRRSWRSSRRSTSPASEIGGLRLPGGVRDGPRGRQHGPVRHPRATEQHFACFEHFIAQAVGDRRSLGVFVMLGINLPLDALWDDLWAGPRRDGRVHLRRPPAGRASSACCPTGRGRWTRQELLFLCWCRETGVVPAAVASLLVADGVPGAELAVSHGRASRSSRRCSLQATTAGLVARRLGLVSAASTSASAGRAPGTAPDVQST